MQLFFLAGELFYLRGTPRDTKIKSQPEWDRLQNKGDRLSGSKLRRQSRRSQLANWNFPCILISNSSLFGAIHKSELQSGGQLRRDKLRLSNSAKSRGCKDSGLVMFFGCLLILPGHTGRRSEE